ncbi:MAG TPA: hypothetical protein VK815_10985 [Candidatus Acidoferrales bacterium]|jgi:hypothetical protein|nr:hypothetical protein [Candidatus Acidoferrales bacterium]
MKTTTGNIHILVAVLGAAWFLAGCGQSPAAPSSSWSLDSSGAATQLKQFLATQEAQARALAKSDGNTLPPDFDAFYQAAGKGDWLEASNRFKLMAQGVRNDSSLRGSWWQATLDDYGVFELFPAGDKYAVAFGHDIIQSIPPGSIYFGGTDPGRFIITAMMKSHTDGKPFFMLSQNPLADAGYLHYLRSMYGGKIQTPTDGDLEKCLRDYLAEAQRRLAHDRQFPNEPRQVKPGDESVSRDTNGQVQLKSQMAVIGARELLTKAIFDQNPGRDFYVEESFPSDWMYPQLEPHGLIMKLNGQPSAGLSADIVQRDADYWSKYLTPLIGGWLKPGTTLEEVAAFVEKIQVKKDLDGFAGDLQFVQNDNACKMFSKLRSSIAGNYAWRAQHAADAGERKRMNDAADFAFRQAWVLCPDSPEALYRYINLLLSEGRTADAVLITETAAKMPSMQGENGGQLHSVIEQLKRFQKAK